MLKIRADQMKAFEQDLIRRFKERLRDRLAGAMPFGTDFDALIERGLAEARSFGLASAAQVARFTEITALHLGGFPDGPLPIPALAILMAYGTEPDVKLDRYLAWAQSIPDPARIGEGVADA